MATPFYVHLSEATTHDNNLDRLYFSGFVFTQHQDTTDELSIVTKAFDNFEAHAPLHLRGSYAGVYWSSKASQWTLFSDPLGTKPLYYAQLSNGWHISNNYDLLAQKIKATQPLSCLLKT